MRSPPPFQPQGDSSLKHALPLVLSVLAALMALLAIPAVALANDSKVTLNIKETVESVTIWRHGIDPKVVILLTPTVADIVYGEGTTWVGGGKTVDVMVFRMPSGNIVLFTDQGYGFTETPIRADAFVLTVEDDPVTPWIHFDLVKNGSDECSDVNIRTNRTILPWMMVYEVVLLEDGRGRVRRHHKFVATSKGPGRVFLDCLRGIKTPTRVDYITALWYNRASNERIEYRCDHQESPDHDGLFPCVLTRRVPVDTTGVMQFKYNGADLEVKPDRKILKNSLYVEGKTTASNDHMLTANEWDKIDCYGCGRRLDLDAGAFADAANIDHGLACSSNDGKATCWIWTATQ